MGINEVSGTWEKLGKFYNAVWRKQYGTSHMSVNFYNFKQQLSILITDINGSQFGILLNIIILLGVYYFFRKNILYAFLISIGWLIFNFALMLYTRYDFYERSIDFVTVFFIFSFFLLSIYLSFGLNFIFDLISFNFKQKKTISNINKN